MDIHGDMAEYIHLSQQASEMQIGSTSKQLYIGYINSYDPLTHTVTVVNPLNIDPVLGNMVISQPMPLFSFLAPIRKGPNPVNSNVPAYGFQQALFGGAQANISLEYKGEQVLVLNIRPGTGYGAAALLMFNDLALAPGGNIPVSGAALAGGEFVYVQPSGTTTHFDNEGNINIYCQQPNGMTGGNVQTMAYGGISLNTGDPTELPQDISPGNIGVFTKKDFESMSYGGISFNTGYKNDPNTHTADNPQPIAVGDIGLFALVTQREDNTGGNINAMAYGGINLNTGVYPDLPEPPKAGDIDLTAVNDVNIEGDHAIVITTQMDTAAGNLNTIDITNVAETAAPAENNISITSANDLLLGAVHNLIGTGRHSVTLTTQADTAAGNANTIDITNVAATPSPSANDISITSTNNLVAGANNDVTITAINDLIAHALSSIYLGTQPTPPAGNDNSINITNLSTAPSPATNDIELNSADHVVIGATSDIRLSATQNIIARALNAMTLATQIDAPAGNPNSINITNVPGSLSPSSNNIAITSDNNLVLEATTLIQSVSRSIESQATLNWAVASGLDSTIDALTTIHLIANGTISEISATAIDRTAPTIVDTASAGDISFAANGNITAVATSHAITRNSATITDTTSTSQTSTGPTINIIGSSVVNVQAPSINVGSAGETLYKLLTNQFLIDFQNHVHTNVTAGADLSGTPSAIVPNSYPHVTAALNAG